MNTQGTHTHTQQAQHGIMLMNKFQPDKKRKIKQKKIRLLCYCCCAMDITLI
jgi:hypothetical protein